MIYIHDDLNGYAGWADTGGPLQAGEDDPLLAALNAQTVTTVTLAYLQGDARGLRAITVAEPQSLWYRGPDLPAASGPVHPRPVPRLEQIPDQVTVLPEFIDATIGPTIARVGQRLDNMLVTLTTGMTAAEVYSIIRGIDPGHHAEIELALARLRKSMGDQWNRDLDTDTNQPTRPTLTLDRDRETMPNPDPDHVAQDRATIVRDLDAIDDLRVVSHVDLHSAVLQLGDYFRIDEVTPRHVVPCLEQRHCKRAHTWTANADDVHATWSRKIDVCRQRTHSLNRPREQGSVVDPTECASSAPHRLQPAAVAHQLSHHVKDP